MPRITAISRTLQRALFLFALVLITWLCVLAVRPSGGDHLPAWLGWFGRPGSLPTVTIVVAVLVTLCVLSWRAHRDSRYRNVPVAVVAGLAATATALGFSSFWNCHNETHPRFFQALIWTGALLKGGMGDFWMSGGFCPASTPTALVVARLAALGAIFVGLAGVAIALFRSQVDRLQANRARFVTVAIGVDAGSRSLIGAITKTLDRRATLVVIADNADEASAQDARARGVRVVSVGLDNPACLRSLALWRHLDRLYLLSADPSTNRLWLDIITGALAAVGQRRRLPLVVRIDDPWQAEAWRAQQFGESDTQWAIDIVGRYEATARWLLDNIIAAKTIQRVLVCGTSELSLALCADLTRRRLEHDYYSAPGEAELPALTLVGEDAELYRGDHEFHRSRLGLVSAGPAIDAVPETPTVPTLVQLIGAGDVANTAAVLVDDWNRGPRGAATTGTRLAARFPTMPVYAWDPDARMNDSAAPIVGRLYMYRLLLETPDGQTPDAWERAASLIHGRYLAAVGPQQRTHPSSLPWAELDEFYRESNRRQVRNALWMVEQIAEHTWDTWGSVPAPLAEREMAGLPPLDQLDRLGFDHGAVMRMARVEHEDWCRYYRHNGWKFGPNRDDTRRTHNRIVDWSVIEAHGQLLADAVASLANTLWSLCQLGYRSRPVWQRFARTGTVTAEQRDTPWTWVSRSGATMRAAPGDWSVGANGECWSVRDDIFRAGYEHIDGDQWHRRGAVLARPAQAGETIDTLEGPTAAADGDWVVRNSTGEEWPVPGDVFAERYVAGDPQPTGEPGVLDAL